MTIDIKAVSTEGLIAATAEALADVREDAATIELLGAEVLERLVKAEARVEELEAEADALEVEPLDPQGDTGPAYLPDPALDPDPLPPSAHLPAEPLDPDAPFQAMRTVEVNSAMGQHQVAALVNAPTGDEMRGTRVVVKGHLGSLYLGGGRNDHIAPLDGSPLRDIEFIGEEVDDKSAEVWGVKLSDHWGDRQQAGVGANVRLTALDIYPMHEDDRCALETLAFLYGAELVLNDIGLCVTPNSTKFSSMGAKWGAVLMGLRLRATSVTTEPTQEHGFYTMNLRGWDVRDVDNETTLRPWGPDGSMVSVGHGRSLFTHQNRVPGLVSNSLGGRASAGEGVLEFGSAYYCGWEGMHIGDKASGGADFTLGGHTGELVRLDHCASVNPYCSSIAVWAEASTKDASDVNPHGVRAWQLDGDAGVKDPRGAFGPLTHAFRRVEILGHAADTGNRDPYLISATKTLAWEVGGHVLAHAVVNHQDNVPAIETFETL